MSEVQLKRLNKVLREFNISLDRAVEFLSLNGHEVEARPTAKISSDQYNLLLEEFRSDKSSKVESHDLSEEKRKEKEELRLKLEREQEEKLNAKSAVIQGKAKITKPVQIGKIDLEKLNLKVSKKETEKEKPKEEKPKLDKKEVSEAVETKKADSKIKTQYKKLSGLKTVGDKIDLNKIETAKSDNKTSAPSLKRKRIRINKDVPKSSKNFVKQNKTKNTPVETSDEDVQKQIRETLEKLQGKSTTSKGAKYRKEKRDSHKLKSEEDLALNEADKKTIKVTEFITVGEIATMMEITSTEIISACMTLGIMVTMNQRLDAETLTIVADEFGYEVEFVTADIEESIQELVDSPKDLLPRAPIVTVMGHVDHGKTSLLDFIREENVIAGESGGITQHIGAYNVELKDGQKITFLDTPGHEAFTAMRARGTQVTDLVIIVIAADDDVMPQTKEAISHAQAAGVPIIFAINKIDRENSNPDKIKEKLSSMNLLVEEWGGKIQSQDVSALKGTGVDELLEKTLLEAEFLELKANPNKAAIGTVVEAFLDKGKGYISTILIQSGTLKIGDYLLAGQHSGKIKAMQDERGNPVVEAGPSIPVSVLGLDGAPQAGDKFNVFENEKEAKQIAVKRTQLVREQSVRTQKHITLDEIGRRIALGDFKELNIILKGDVDGSVEALTDSFQKLSTDEIHINIIHKAVGAITESDVLLASASDAIIIGFNVRPTGNARQIADKEEIDIRNYSIIYDAINDLKDAMEGMLSPEFKEEITGNAEIRETFKISKVGTIAGCMITDGKIFKKSSIRLIREGVVLMSGTLASLKRFKDDVKEVAKGYDCGIQINNYNDIIVGDIIEAFSEVEIKKKIK
ncbi:MAG: translation initiation factor IF-2 [Flavobacteriaceae bacterium]|jgi:translation initiation factor IF-2|nr:translation initiation factor IF-2 [Pelagibacterales bacterium]MBT4709577.1 translation initiation factor IF-2 [Flavobacteriaceae bacterium]